MSNTRRVVHDGRRKLRPNAVQTLHRVRRLAVPQQVAARSAAGGSSDRAAAPERPFAGSGGAPREQCENRGKSFTGCVPCTRFVGITRGGIAHETGVGCQFFSRWPATANRHSVTDVTISVVRNVAYVRPVAAAQAEPARCPRKKRRGGARACPRSPSHPPP